MKLLYGTKNEAKLAAMKSRLTPMGIRVLGLKDIDFDIPDIEEAGKSPAENAYIKAKKYYDLLHIPVFSCDSGLYFDEVSDENLPGIMVRRINGKTLSDEEMVKYYVNLSKKYNGLTARYKTGICLYLDENHVYTEMSKDMESRPFLITDNVRPIKRKGFPIDSISVDINSGKHFYDCDTDFSDKVAVEAGIIRFFEKHILDITKLCK